LLPYDISFYNNYYDNYYIHNIIHNNYNVFFMTFLINPSISDQMLFKKNYLIPLENISLNQHMIYCFFYFFICFFTRSRHFFC